MNTHNFINPLSPKKQIQIRTWYYISATAFIILTLILTCITGYYGWVWYRIRKQMQIHKIQEREVSDMIQQHKKMQEELTNLQEKQKKLKYYKEYPYNPGHYLQILEKLIPNDVRLTLFSIGAHKTIELQGQAFSPQTVIQFVNALTKSQQFTNMQLATLFPVHAAQEKEQQLYAFTIKGNIVNISNA